MTSLCDLTSHYDVTTPLCTVWAALTPSTRAPTPRTDTTKSGAPRRSKNTSATPYWSSAG